jgi:hypothetical protein
VTRATPTCEVLCFNFSHARTVLVSRREDGSICVCAQNSFGNPAIKRAVERPLRTCNPLVILVHINTDWASWGDTRRHGYGHTSGPEQYLRVAPPPPPQPRPKQRGPGGCGCGGIRAPSKVTLLAYVAPAHTQSGPGDLEKSKRRHATSHRENLTKRNRRLNRIGTACETYFTTPAEPLRWL